MGTSKASLDLSGTPSLIALSGNELRLGTEGNNDIVFVRNGSVVGRVSSAGLVAQFDLANNSWLQARNAANSADLDLIRATAANATQLNTASGTSIALSVNGSTTWSVSSALTQDGTNGSDIVFNVSGTGLRMGTSDGADTGILMLSGGGAQNSSIRGAYCLLNGNEATGTGQAIIGAGNVAGALVRLFTSGAHPVEFYTAATLRMGVSGAGSITLERTNTAGGTTGNQTINKMAGSVNFAAAATTLTVTNSLVSATSNVFCAVQTGDATAAIKNVVPGAGSFVITLSAAATAETRVAFWVTN